MAETPEKSTAETAAKKTETVKSTSEMTAKVPKNYKSTAEIKVSGKLVDQIMGQNKAVELIKKAAQESGF